MSNYYGEEIYRGPEAILVSMDIGTTQSERYFGVGASLIQSFRRRVVRSFRTRYTFSSANGIYKLQP
jgi:hypothetical protein